VRTSYLDQLIVDLNAQTGATCLIVTHNINTARSVPDNIGLLYRRHLAMFGPRGDLLTSEEPVVLQFMNGRKQGPIGMSEEKDAAELAAEADDDVAAAELPDIEPQMLPSWPLVRPSMASPHGSHAFLRDPSQRASIPFGTSFGENGLEPSDEPPSRAMSPEKFRELTGYREPAGRHEPARHEPPVRPLSPVPAATVRPAPKSRPRPAPVPSGAQTVAAGTRPSPNGSPVARGERPRPTPFSAPPEGVSPPASDADGRGGRKGVLAGWRGRRGDRE
jgi:phospholipid/cholesterol/gamma-HCH transport system ATP-binding protein